MIRLIVITKVLQKYRLFVVQTKRLEEIEESEVINQVAGGCEWIWAVPAEEMMAIWGL